MRDLQRHLGLGCGGLGRTLAAAAVAAMLIAGLASAAGPASSPSAAAGSESRPARETRLRVVAFYAPGCPGCDELLEALAEGERRWGRRILVQRRHIGETRTFREFIQYESHYRSDENKVPKVFVGEQYLVGAAAAAGRLDGVIAEELARGSKTFAPPPEPAGEDSEDKIGPGFRNLSIGSVVVAGLVDGVNPCAFATIIFLLSMLKYLGRSRREVAVVGIGFTAAVFLTYLLLGFALLRAVKEFSVSYGIAKPLAGVAAGFAFVLAGWSLIDFVRYIRSGDAKVVTLALPKGVKSRIHKVIRVGLSAPGLIALGVGSLAVGFLVALLESACTGQVYLLIVFVIANVSNLRAHAAGYLLVYNLMFIVPLVGILAIAYLGVRSERLGAFLTRHLAALKLALAVLFAGLGLLVLATV